MSKSEAEATLAFQLKAVGLTSFEREVRFHPPRRWRFDFADWESKIAVEVQGGIWMDKSGHNTGKGLKRDYEKHNAAMLDGWALLFVTTGQVESGEALSLIEELYNQRTTYNAEGREQIA